MNVLIVDDEPQARERLSRMVSELEGILSWSRAPPMAKRR